MNSSALLFGIIPLLVFVIVDTFAGLKTALISTVIMAIVEALFSLYLFKEVDSTTLFSLITVILFCYISFKKKDPLFLKLQPAILSFTFGAALVISYAIDKPFLLAMATKYSDFYPDHLKAHLQTPRLLQILTLSTLSMGLGLFAHALVTAIAAFKLSNWWWLAVRGVGFYVFMFLAVYLQKFFI